MTGRPVAYTSSIAAWAGSDVGSLNASRAGIPQQQRPVRIATIPSLHHSMTWAGPRNSAIATAIARPSPLPTSLGSPSTCELSTARIPEQSRMSPGCVTLDDTPFWGSSADSTPVLGGKV